MTMNFGLNPNNPFPFLPLILRTASASPMSIEEGIQHPLELLAVIKAISPLTKRRLHCYRSDND